MKIEIKYVDENKTFYVVLVETETIEFTLTYKYSKDYDAWALLEPVNNKGYKLYTLNPEFKNSIKSELLKIIK